MKLWFLPFVREGLMPTATAAARTQVAVALRVESPGRESRDVVREMSLIGPGDILAIEPRQVLRVAPAAGTRDAEPEFFPAIEFDAPDLPWAYSPVVPEGTRLLPWIALVVVEARPDVTIVPGQRGQSPWLLRLSREVAERELPDLADSWAWAHAQVACEKSDQIAATLAAHPDRTLARLLSPRRLHPHRAYHACVVPAFLAGRIAGLGGEPAADPALLTGLEPAWSVSDLPSELPVYYSWTFRTGEAGDFEALAQRLRPASLEAPITATPLQLSLPVPVGELAVEWEPPLRVPGSAPEKPRRPAAAVTQIRNALKPGTPARPVLGPAYFGAPWRETAPAAPLTQWGPELNLTPMFRAAAGLGAEAVRAEQESLVAAASAQLEAFRARQREGRRKQLAAAFAGRVSARLSRAPRSEAARVLAPLAAASQPAALDVGLYTVAGRRIVRKLWAATQARPAATQPLGDLRPIVQPAGEALPVLQPLGEPLPGLQPADELPELLPAIVYRPAIERAPVQVPAPPAPPADAAGIPTGEFAPRFARPMSEPLAERYPELMLPGATALDADTVRVVESDPKFLEAFLVGANQELNYELRWRGLPADARATPFRRFWGHVGDAEDIDGIASWDAAGALGTHVETRAAMILLVRSELVRRYPTLLIAVVPGTWMTGGTRSPSKDPASLMLPAFRGRIGAEVLYAGFSSPSIVEAIGARKPEEGSPGWYFLLGENPGDPRFGLDPGGGTAPPTRATLSWRHLTLSGGAEYATLAAFPAVPDAGFVPHSATAASVASLVRQRPFRAFIHASLLIRQVE